MNSDNSMTIKDIKDILFESLDALDSNKYNKNVSKNYSFFTFDLNYTNTSFILWKQKFDKEKYSLNRAYCFTDLLLVGFLTNGQQPNTIKDKLSGFISGLSTRLSYLKKDIHDRIMSDKLIITADGTPISEGALIIRIIYEAQKKVLESLANKNDINKLYDKLSTLLKEKEFEIPNIDLTINVNDNPSTETDYSRTAKLLLYSFLCALGFEKDESIKLLFKQDAFDSKCFNPKLDIWHDLKRPDHYIKLFSETGIIGNSSSLKLLKHGYDILQSLPNYNKNDTDGYTLLLLSDLFYYQNVNTASKDSILNAYLFSCLAYTYDETSIEAAYNIGYNHYVLSQSSSDTMFENLRKYIEDTDNQNKVIKDKKWKEQINKNKSEDFKLMHLNIAIDYFTWICTNHEHPAALTSLGNIAMKYHDKEYSNPFINLWEIKNCIINICNNRKENHPAKTSDLKSFAFVCYDLAAKNGDLEAMYNLVRMLEKELSSTEMQPVTDEAYKRILLSTYLFQLYQNKHPKGVNLFLSYVIYENFNSFAKDCTKFNDDFYKINDDLIPSIYKNKPNEKYNISTAPITTLNQIIEDYHYVSEYTYPQLTFFWPTYHYCLFKLMRITHEDELSELREKLIRVLSNDIIKKEPDYSKDQKKGYLLLLKIANYNEQSSGIQNSEIEREIISTYIRSKIYYDESIIGKYSEIDKDIMNEFIILEASLFKKQTEKLIKEQAQSYKDIIDNAIANYENKLSNQFKTINTNYQKLNNQFSTLATTVNEGKIKAAIKPKTTTDTIYKELSTLNQLLSNRLDDIEKKIYSNPTK